MKTIYTRNSNIPKKLITSNEVFDLLELKEPTHPQKETQLFFVYTSRRLKMCTIFMSCYGEGQLKTKTNTFIIIV